MVFATRKRTYAGAPRLTRFKRSRFTKPRRNVRKTRRTADYTSLATRSTLVGFRGRKSSRRAYKNHIWNSTKFKDHWRSYLTLTRDPLETVTPAGLNTGTVNFVNMYNFVGDPFWTAAGGAVEKDLTLGVPDFADVILRGGKFTLTLTNNSTTNDIKFKIWRFNTGNNPDLILIPNNVLGPVDQAWDPSVVPDFYTQVGKPFMAREVTLEQGNSYSFVTRFKTQKIDQNAYNVLQQSRSPFVMIMASNVGNGISTDYTMQYSYNLSYAGDAVSPAP